MTTQLIAWLTTLLKIVQVSSVILKKNGSGGRTRTGTELPQPDFESGVSTNFTTPP